MKKYLIASAVLMTAFSSNAIAAPNLVTNGGFETTTVQNSQQFAGNQVAGWTNAQTNGYTGYGYNFLIKPNTADTTGYTSFGGNLDKLYGPNGGVNSANYSANGFTGTSPSGGNFILADGDTSFHGAISQTINGLVAGNTYTVSFDWAGASWFTTPGNTTERFDVSLGGLTQATNTVVLGPKGFSGWQTTSMNFVAGGTSQTLSFLAQGTPNGLPPSLLLDNVSLTAAVPEPATWGMMIVGFGAVGAATVRFA